MKVSKTIFFAVIIVSTLTAFGNGYLPVIDLGTLGGESSYAISISHLGRIVGAADNNSGSFSACVYQPGDASQNRDLGTLGGAYSEAYSSNNAGQIVGYAMNSFGYERACRFNATGGGANTDLGTLGGNWSSASCTNNYGQIVGVADNGTSYGRACSFDPTGGGVNTDLGTLGGDWSSAYSINNAGQIVGKANNSTNNRRACLFDPTGGGANIDLGAFVSVDEQIPNGDWSVAYSINNAGQIVGEADGTYEHSFSSQACIFDPTGDANNIIRLGGLHSDNQYPNSVARCINDIGQIVGAVYSGLQSRACLFDPNGVLWSYETYNENNIDLNTLIDPNCGWLLTDAWSINNNGWIVGQGVNPAGDAHAFLLVPEPATICLLTVGCVSLIRRKKKKT
ncbi:MAG: PEP-CTERM sorting domain-containing protein [Sedimentisphaerales bacterium]|nr:PEP-CTERM sorting domain-containing protein [Sedimentisphaerales bacterium]